MTSERSDSEQSRLTDQTRSERDEDGRLWHMLPPSIIDGSLEELEGLLAADAHSSEASGLRVRVPQAEGRGHWDFFRRSRDLWIMSMNAEYDQDRCITIPGDRMVKIRIMLSGELEAPHNGVSLKGTGAYLEAYPGAVASSYLLRGSQPVRLLILNCSPDFFVRDLAIPGDTLPDPISHLFQLETGSPRGGAAPLSPDVLRAANDMMRAAAHYPAHLLGPYLEARAREVICSVLRDLEISGEPARSGLRLSVRDVNRIYEARDTLVECFQRPPSIPKLARQVGVNQTKLKAGFKAVFGMTMYDFIQKCRMDRAGELLAQGELSIAEVAFAVGYDYPANFTYAFKRFYGHVPRKMRRAADTARSE